MIDDVMERRNRIFEQDIHIFKEDRHRRHFEEVKERINEEYEFVKSVYPEQEITKDNMPELLDRYLTSHSEREDIPEIIKRVNGLREAMKSYDRDQRLIMETQERKEVVYDEINSNVKKINDIRKARGMSEYRGGSTSVSAESTLSLEQRDEFRRWKYSTLEEYLASLK